VKNLLRFLRGHTPDIVALSAKLDGALDERDAARLDAHLMSCAACAGVLDGLRATRAALRAIPPVDAPRSFRLRAADVEAMAAREERRAPAQRWAPLAAGCAAIVLAVIIGASLYANRGSSTNQAATGALSAERANAPAKAAVNSAIPASGSAGASANAPVPAIPPATQTSGVAAPDVAQSTPSDAAVAAATASAREAVRPAPTATGQLQGANGPATSSARGNNSTAIHVIEIVALVAALAAAAVAFGWWRRGGRRS
jgi:hypothetical protein